MHYRICEITTVKSYGQESVSERHFEIERWVWWFWPRWKTVWEYYHTTKIRKLQFSKKHYAENWIAKQTATSTKKVIT